MTLRQWKFRGLYLSLPQAILCLVARQQPWGEDVPPVLPAQGAAAPHLLLPALHLQGPLPGGLLLPGQLPAGVQGLEPVGLLQQPLEEGQACPQHTGAGNRQHEDSDILIDTSIASSAHVHFSIC